MFLELRNWVNCNKNLLCRPLVESIRRLGSVLFFKTYHADTITPVQKVMTPHKFGIMIHNW